MEGASLQSGLSPKTIALIISLIMFTFVVGYFVWQNYVCRGNLGVFNKFTCKCKLFAEREGFQACSCLNGYIERDKECVECGGGVPIGDKSAPPNQPCCPGDRCNSEYKCEDGICKKTPI